MDLYGAYFQAQKSIFFNLASEVFDDEWHLDGLFVYYTFTLEILGYFLTKWVTTMVMLT